MILLNNFKFGTPKNSFNVLIVIFVWDTLENQYKNCLLYNLDNYIKRKYSYYVYIFPSHHKYLAPYIFKTLAKNKTPSNFSSTFTSSYISLVPRSLREITLPSFLPFLPPHEIRKEKKSIFTFDPWLRPRVPTSDKFADGPLIPSNGRIIQDSGGALAVTRPEWRIKRAPGAGRIAAACQASRDPKNFHLHRSKF